MTTYTSADLETRLSSFVQEICKDRDPSHGHQHMEEVAQLSMDIFHHKYPHPEDVENYGRLLVLTLIVAWMHDVPDHKYDHDGKSGL